MKANQTAINSRQLQTLPVSRPARVFDGGRVSMFGFPVSQRLLLFGVMDMLILLLSVGIGYIIRTAANDGLSISTLWMVLDKYSGASGFLVLTSLTFLYVFGVYGERQRFGGRLVLQILLAMFFAALVTTGLYYIRPSWKFGRGILALSLLSATTLIVAQRFVMSKFLAVEGRAKRLLVAGAGWSGKELARLLANNDDYHVVGFVDDNQELVGKIVDGLPVFGKSGDAERLVAELRIDELAIAVSQTRGQEFLRSIFRCKIKGCSIIEMADLYKMVAYKVPIKHVTDQWFIFNSGFNFESRIFLKNTVRLLDVGLSSLGLILSAPLLLIAMVAIKIDSRGPVLFRQRRVGQYGREFDILKLRTMRDDAERATGPVWSSGATDPRVTAVGRFLRRTRIDELPQLLTVLRGDMSFVGPRPERRIFVDRLCDDIPYYALRHTIKPGLTGWAQVSLGYTNDNKGALEKLQYDLFYIQDMSLFLYVLTILKTVTTVLTKPGS